MFVSTMRQKYKKRCGSLGSDIAQINFFLLAISPLFKPTTEWLDYNFAVLSLYIKIFPGDQVNPSRRQWLERLLRHTIS